MRPANACARILAGGHAASKTARAKCPCESGIGRATRLVMKPMPFDVEADPLDEAHLLARYAKGDAIAARVLTARLAPRALAQAARLLGDGAEAEDVAQEAMVRLWKVAPDWRADEAKVSTWLYKVVANLSTDRLRRRKGSRVGLDEIAEPEDPSPRAEDRMLAEARRAALAKALAGLPERQRLALMLRHFEGASNPDIADRLGVSVEAVESLTARGKRALAAALAGQASALGYEG